MFLFSNINLWLLRALDPITISDWVGNREVFGVVEKPSETDLEMETAYQIESLQEKKLLQVIAPEGIAKSVKKVLQVEIASAKPQKFVLNKDEVKVVILDLAASVKIKARASGGLNFGGRGEAVWTVGGTHFLIIDARGRPARGLSPEQQIELKQIQGA